MNVLITGGAGFIGSRTAAQLVDKGHTVTLLDSLSEQIHGSDPERSPTLMSIRDRVELVVGDVRDRDLVMRLVPDFEAVIHLAAETGTGQSMYDIVRYNDVNVMGTANLLEAIVNQSSKVRRIVVASSRSIYGEGAYRCGTHGVVYPNERNVAALEVGHFDPLCPICAEPLAVSATSEAAALSPASVYAVTKLAQENLITSVARAKNLSAFALRYQNVYGQGQSLSNPYTGILSIFSREMLNGRDIEVFEDGEESRDFVHVDDIAAANVAAVESTLGGVHILNVGFGEPTSVNQLVKALAHEFGFEGNVRISGRFRAGDIRHNFADLAALKNVLEISPKVTLESGLAEFCAWVRDTLSSVPEKDDAYRRSLSELEARGLIGDAKVAG